MQDQQFEKYKQKALASIGGGFQGSVPQVIKNAKYIS